MEDAANSRIYHFLLMEGRSFSTSEIIQRLKAVFGESSESKSIAYCGINRLKKRRTNLKDDSHSGPPNTAVNEENVVAVEKMLTGDRRIIIRKNVASVCFSSQKVRDILHDRLGVSKASAR